MELASLLSIGPTKTLADLQPDLPSWWIKACTHIISEFTEHAAPAVNLPTPISLARNFSAPTQNKTLTSLSNFLFSSGFFTSELRTVRPCLFRLPIVLGELLLS